MIGAEESAINFGTGRERTDLNSDQKLLFVLVRVIEVVDEAAARVSVATREAAAEIPWGLMGVNA